MYTSKYKIINSSLLNSNDLYINTYCYSKCTQIHFQPFKYRSTNGHTIDRENLPESISYLSELANALSFFLELKNLTFQRSVLEHNVLSDSTWVEICGLKSDVEPVLRKHIHLYPLTRKLLDLRFNILVSWVFWCWGFEYISF